MLKRRGEPPPPHISAAILKSILSGQNVVQMWRLLMVAYVKRVGLTLIKTLVLALQHYFTFDTCLGRFSTNKAVNWHDK